MCKIISKWEAAVKHGELSSVLCDDPEGQGEDGAEGQSKRRGYMYTCS